MKVFLKSLAANMLLRFGWGIAAILYFILSRLFGLPLYFTFIILGLWVIISSLITVMLMTGRGSVENKKDLKLPPYRFGNNAVHELPGDVPEAENGRKEPNDT